MSLLAVLAATFLLQLAMKLGLRASMQYFWELVHQLQFLRFLVLIDVPFPSNVEGFVSFMQLTSLNFNNLPDIWPDVPSFILDEEQLAGEYYLLPSRF